MQEALNRYRLLLASELGPGDDRWKQALRMADRHFQTSGDPEQMSLDEGVGRWILSEIPDCWCILFREEEVIGDCFVLPTSAASMDDFIAGRIPESRLLEQSRHSGVVYECLYLAGAYVETAYRGQGLAAMAFKRIFESLRQKDIFPQAIYGWPWSAEGERLLRKLASVEFPEARVSARSGR